MPNKESHKEKNDFERHVKGKAPGFFAEFWYFFRHNRRWWVTPVIIALLLIGLLVVFGGAGAAPFIYTLF